MQAQKKAEEEEYTRLEREAAEVTEGSAIPSSTEHVPNIVMQGSPGEQGAHVPSAKLSRQIYSAGLAHGALPHNLLLAFLEAADAAEASFAHGECGTSFVRLL